MMFKDINATNFDYCTPFYINEFEDILRGIIVCYQCINSSEVKLPNDENGIRNCILTKYLKEQEFKERHKLTNYLFIAEQPINEGRVDISVFSRNQLDIDTFYVIECKRLNNQNLSGTTGLNSEYVKNGICRFVSDYYPSHFGINGMIGFVVDNLDIDSNIANLNSFLNKDLINDKKETVNAKAVQEIKQIELYESFRYSYTSTHKTRSEREITLYHLMFDFSNNIQ